MLKKFNDRPVIRLIIRLYLLVVFISSCQDSHTIRKWYYPDGKLKKVQSFKDLIKDGEYLYYFPTGVLQDSATFIMGKLHGIRHEYYSNGQLQASSIYINDILRNGILYRSDGRIQYYKAYDYNGVLAFAIQYDSLNRVDYIQGNAIYNFVLEDSYPSNSKINFELLVAAPPNATIFFKVIEGDSLNTNNTSVEKIEPDFFNRITYHRYQNPDRDLKLINILQITDTLSSLDIKDTLTLVVDRQGKSSYYR